MNIDVRNLKSEVLKSMQKLIKDYKFSSTAKATRFVLVDYWRKISEIKTLKKEKIELISLHKKDINKLEKELLKYKKEQEKLRLLKEKLKEFINSENIY